MIQNSYFILFYAIVNMESNDRSVKFRATRTILYGKIYPPLNVTDMSQ